MAGLVSNVLLLSLHCVLLKCTEHAFKLVYKPYGIEMCRELCQDSADAFYFIQEGLSCIRVSPNDSVGLVKVSSQTCLVKDSRTKCPFHTGMGVCNREDEGSTEIDLDLHDGKETAETGKNTTLSYDEVFVQNDHNFTLHQACEEGKMDVVKYILSQGLEDINCRGKTGRTPVMTAAKEGQVKVFEYLVSQGCDLSAVNDYNSNVLHYACLGGNTEIVRKLIVSNKCDLESVGYRGKTPVMYAARFGHSKVVELLVEKGCNLMVTDKYKDNTFHLACKGGHVDVVEFILSLNVVNIESRGYMGGTPILRAAGRGQKEVFDFLVGQGCNVNAVDDQNDNILHVACRGGHIDMVQYILSRNIVSVESRGFDGRTPVMVAAENGCKDVFDFLVKQGCKLTAVDDDKNNILSVACIGGHVDMVKYLLSLRAVEGMEKVKNMYGRTPVMVADTKGFAAVVILLKNRK